MIEIRRLPHFLTLLLAAACVDDLSDEDSELDDDTEHSSTGGAEPTIDDFGENGPDDANATTEDCNNAIDDDGDGATDCNDDACVGNPVCGATPQSVAPPAPVLFDEKFRNAPVRGEAGELLLIPGWDLSSSSLQVIFQKFDTALTPVFAVPASNSGTHFMCTTTSTYCRIRQQDAAGVVVELPAAFQSGQRYRVAARIGTGIASNALILGDARPQWVSPSFLYRTANRPGIPGRTLNVIGRNLDLGNPTQVRLTHCFSGVNYDFVATASTGARAKYVASITVGTNLPVGAYAVSVKRGTASDFRGQTCSAPELASGDLFTIRDNPPTPTALLVTSAAYGGCAANDGNDDSGCIINAIADAKSRIDAGTAQLVDVVFPSGTWDIKGTCVESTVDPGWVSCINPYEINGILVPPGVGLRSTGAPSRIVKHPSWNPELLDVAPPIPPDPLPIPPDPPWVNPDPGNIWNGRPINPYTCAQTLITLPGGEQCQTSSPNPHPFCNGKRFIRPVFMLTEGTAFSGRNRVQNLVFEDLSNPNSFDLPTSFFQVGQTSATGLLEDITFTGNQFINVGYAIEGSGTYKNLTVTQNDFTAHFNALFLGWAGARVLNSLPAERLEDAIISGNVMRPGDFVDVPAEQGGAAFALGGGQRFFIADNQVLNDDGDAVTVNDPDETGFRAGFFFHSSNNVEKALVLDNFMECTGSQAGDGESIVFDSNLAEYPFLGPKAVVSATASTVNIDVSADGFQLSPLLYAEHSIQIGAGPGLGQTRKITSIDTTTAPGQARFNVTPPWCR